MSSRANYSYPLSRHPDSTASNGIPRPIKHSNDPFSDQPAPLDRKPAYTSSRVTTHPPQATYTLPHDLASRASGIPFSIAARHRPPPVTHVPSHHERKESRFDDACEEGAAGGREGRREGMCGLDGGKASTVQGNAASDGSRRRVFTAVPANVTRNEQTSTQSKTSTTLKPSSRNYSLNAYTVGDPGPSKIQHTPNRLRKPNTSPVGKSLVEPITVDPRRSSLKITGPNKPAARDEGPPSLPSGNPPPYTALPDASRSGSKIPLLIPTAVPQNGKNNAITPAGSDPAGRMGSLGRKVGEGGKGFSDRKAEEGPALRRSDQRAIPVPSEPGAPVISKKKSMIRFAAGFGKPKPADGDGGIGGLVKRTGGGFGRRKVRREAEEGDGSRCDTTFSTAATQGDVSVVSDAVPTRPSTDSEFSVMSDWTITDLSDVSSGLPADSEHGTAGVQNGGVVGAVPGKGRTLGKKKSFAAAGVLLNKILHGPGEKRDRYRAEGGEDLLKKLRHEESTMTLRPTKTTSNSEEAGVTARKEIPTPASPTSSIGSFESRYPAQPPASVRAYSDASHPSSTNGGIPGSGRTIHEPGARGKSPELPSFHFTRPSYSGTNFRADLGEVGCVGESVPPVPPLPVCFLDKSSGGKGEPKPVGVARNPGLKETVPVHRPTPTPLERESNPHRANRSAVDQSQISMDESGGSSLVHVEHALGIDDDYSLTSESASGCDDGRRHSGKLPWRRSVQGVFFHGENDARRDGTDHMIDGLSVSSALDKRPSLMDLKKVSKMTGSLQALINAYPVSPSSLNEQDASIGEGSTCQVGAMRRSPSVRLGSPSSSNAMEQDSPTPMRKYVHHPYSRSLKPGPRSPVKVSPLRLALGNSAAKVQQNEVVANSSSRSQKIFDDNPFLASMKSSSLRSSGISPDSGKINNLHFEMFGTDGRSSSEGALSDAASVYSDQEPLGSGIINGSGTSQAMPLLHPTSSFRMRGCSTNTEDTSSSADQDDQPRESFDFTGEYRALTGNATRQSFVDELERFGLDIGEESFKMENVVSGSDEGSGAVQRTIDSVPAATAAGVPTCMGNNKGIAGRNSYGFNANFKFGSSPGALPTAKRNAVDTDLPGLGKTTPTCAPPNDPLPVPEGSPRFKGRFRFKQNGPEDSMFSIATMSSVGPVVHTGIAGTNFINIFDRDFGAALGGRDRSISSINLQSSIASADSSGEHQRLHLRKASHARVPSFASITSRNESLRYNVLEVGHKRQESSLDSSQSVIRHLGRPTVDSDRMFETSNRNQLYSIQGSPAKGSRNRPQIKYSKDSLLDSSRHISTKDSILNSLPEITEDSIFHSGFAEKSASFAIKSVQALSDIPDVAETLGSVSPLALKRRHPTQQSPAGMESLERRGRLLDSSQQELADIEKYLLRAGTGESADEISFNSFTSFIGNGSRKTRKPSRNTQSRPSSFLLGNAELPALSSPGRSDGSSRLSTDVHSFISAMMEAEPSSKNRWSRRLKGLSQLSEQAPVILEELSRVPCPSETLSVPSLCEELASTSKRKGMLNKWVDWQRLAEDELTRSRATWQDTKQSIGDVADFKPPTTVKELKQMLRNSLDLNQPLSEVSPGTQVTRRELFQFGKFNDAEESTGSSCGSANKPTSALPTKYMRADSSTAASFRFKQEDEVVQPSSSVSAVFAKFAMPANTKSPASEKAVVSLAPKAVNVLPKRREAQLAKQPSGGRQRVTSTVRREKMGWSRRKDAAVRSPAAQRHAEKSSRILVHDANKENSPQ